MVLSGDPDAVAPDRRRGAARVHAGAHGAVLAPNDPLAFVCTLGLLRVGLGWLPLNARDAAEMSTQ